jgi:lipopolysaccharide biosynthesis protein
MSAEIAATSANGRSAAGTADDVRLIAFYLPQFHPIPENDRWWGKGFTEWINVVRATPRFLDHYQPHLPADLGFYDLRLPDAREAQAQLACAYGIHGFCYYYYWFNGHRLLERPLDEVLALRRPRFPYCVCWANENWTRRWDGYNEDVLIAQRYSPQDDLAFIESLMPHFEDERYIRVGDRPLLLVFRVGQLPEPGRTADIWRRAARARGIAEPYLVQVESAQELIDPRSIGFDASTQFAGLRVFPRAVLRITSNTSSFSGHLLDYDAYAEDCLERDEPDYKLFKCVMPSWDNTPRRGDRAAIFVNSSPEKYEAWLRAALDYTRKRFRGPERLLFVNAWNEWAEGTHLEPDTLWGHRWLEALRSAVAVKGWA